LNALSVPLNHSDLTLKKVNHNLKKHILPSSLSSNTTAANTVNVSQHKLIHKVWINDTLFDAIANDLTVDGFSIKHDALPPELISALQAQQLVIPESNFKNAGIGRETDFIENKFVRTDEICWITGNTEAGKSWLDWASSLQSYLNKRLYLGLFSFESHFAHYAPGKYYKRHLDAFKGETNRVLSIVVYLNSGWTQGDGGELVMYKNQHDLEGISVAPQQGTLVAFLSEEFPHEVLPTKRDRYSIAGWFRVNSSSRDKVDPPA